MQYLKWSVVVIVHLFAAICAFFPIMLMLSNFNMKRRGKVREHGVSTMPFVATITLIFTAPLYFQNTFFFRIALMLIILDLGFIGLALYSSIVSNLRRKN